jgi:hypothetical protein
MPVTPLAAQAIMQAYMGTDSDDAPHQVLPPPPPSTTSTTSRDTAAAVTPTTTTELYYWSNKNSEINFLTVLKSSAETVVQFCLKVNRLLCRTPEDELRLTCHRLLNPLSTGKEAHLGNPLSCNTD